MKRIRIIFICIFVMSFISNKQIKSQEFDNFDETKYFLGDKFIHVQRTLFSFFFYKTDCWILEKLLHWRFHFKQLNIFDSTILVKCVTKIQKIENIQLNITIKNPSIEISISSWMGKGKCNYPNFICESSFNANRKLIDLNLKKIEKYLHKKRTF